MHMWRWLVACDASEEVRQAATWRGEAQVGLRLEREASGDAGREQERSEWIRVREGGASGATAALERLGRCVWIRASGTYLLA